MDCCQAVPAVLYHPDSRLTVVFGPEQEAGGKDTVYGRSQAGYYGDPQATGAHRRGHHIAVRCLLRLRRRHPGGGQGLFRRGYHPGDCPAGLHSHPRAVCGDRGAGGGRRALPGEDGAADP